MAAKKPLPKAKKPVKKAAPKKVAAAKKPEPAKKAAPVQKAAPVKPAAKAAPAKPAVKPVAAKPLPNKPAPEAAKPAATEAPVPAAAAKAPKPTPSPSVKVASKPVSAASIVRPITAPTLVARREDSDSSQNEGEDAEGQEPPSPSLLAGPRNVKPYIPRRGEQYMNKEQLEHFRMILGNWKRDLMQEVDRTMLHMKDEAANFPDPNDRATQESEFSLELRTRDRERKLIRKIDEAISRIEDGTYGYCVETGEEIGIKRLEARPVATLCVEAQERRERREKQYGDRDDRYR